MLLHFSPVVRAVVILILAALFGYFYYVIGTTPNNFPVGKSFTVEEGESLRSISTRMRDEGYIRNALWFRAWVSFLGRDRHVQLGGYIFEAPQTLSAIVHKLVFGKPDVPLVSVTIPEGSTTHEIASLLKKALPNFSLDIFGENVSSARADGKLFPSTYFLLPSTTEGETVALMTTTFEKKYTEKFAKTGVQLPLRNREDVISLAAILEGEAKSQEDMEIVAGILVKRLTLGMPLQVDAAPETYKKKGLPLQPINNPGLIALASALSPQASSYLYYITGKDGTMHYAKTFEEHKKNIQKYLR